MQLLLVMKGKEKKNYVVKFCPPNFVDSFAPLEIWLESDEQELTAIRLLNQ